VIYKGEFILVSHLWKMFLNNVGHMKMFNQYVFNEPISNFRLCRVLDHLILFFYVVSIEMFH